jgi:hypothetical protein
MKVIVFWVLRNLLLGIVITGYDSVRGEMEAMRAEQEDVNRLSRSTTSQLSVFRRWERVVWRILASQRMDLFLSRILQRAETKVVTTKVGFHLFTIFQQIPHYEF